MVHVGRCDQQVQIRGVRVEIAEVEATLARAPAVREAAAVATREPDPRLVAYIVLDPDCIPGELRAFLRDQLSEPMRPSAILRLEAIPRTPNGKVDRQRLSKLSTTPVGLGSPRVSPKTPFQVQLAQIWCEILDQPEVGIHDNFFEIGGHSLLATRVLVRMRSHMATDLTLRQFFETPTIAGLEQSAQETQQPAAHEQAPIGRVRRHTRRLKEPLK